MDTAIRVIPQPPQTQALSCRTFRPPPLDGSLTLPELYEWHLKNTPEHRLFVFARDDGSIRTIFWPEAVRAIHVGARTIRQRLGWKPAMQEMPIVAILAAADTISYFTMTVAIMRANYIAFPISPRNSAAAVAHLINEVGVTHVLVGHEPAILQLLEDALSILGVTYPSASEPEVSPIPLFPDLFSDSFDHTDDLPYDRKGPDAIAIYLHSSGSTTFPKPIPYTNSRLIELALIPYFGERDLTDQVLSLHTMPMYHAMGILQLCWTSSSGLVISAFEPKSPAEIPTPDGLFKAAVASESDIIFCVPSIIEAWSHNLEYLKWLATRAGVLFGGGPLNKAAGDYMTSQGVSVFILYGTTEGGIMSPIIPKKVGYDWDYFKFPGNVTPEMLFFSDGIFEFVMVSNPFCRPSVLNTMVNGIDAYATSDLFTPHPTKPGYWRIYGRTDDQIIHNTGEKTNPGPLENILNQDVHVQASVVFGRGHFQAGVIVEPKPTFAFNPTDEVRLAQFRNAIWPTIQKMNTFAPQHSRIFKEMVIVAAPSKPFQYTAKITARRQVILNSYSDEIKALYKTVEESTQVDIPPPYEWTIVDTTDFVRSVVNKVLVHAVTDDVDIFEHGCDSLQATWIRNSLLRALRDSAQLDTRRAVDNFVYEHPTISRMARFILQQASDATRPNDEVSRAEKIAAMHAMVDKYSSDFPSRQSLAISDHKPSCDAVLVTGTTGALGCYILAQLAHDPSFKRVYALNRPGRFGQKDLVTRQRESLSDRGLDVSILNLGKICLIEADVALPSFGLSENVYDEIRHSVTHIIHAAWPVEFNLSLASFEPSVKGLRRLIDFSLASPLPLSPKLIYTSSIGVFRNIQMKEEQAENSIAAEVAIGMGYAESKWVSESILAQATKKTSLRALTVRVGQLCGGLNGAWNTKEWVPALIQSASIVGCLPTDDKDVSWMPMPTAAKALVDFCTVDLGSVNVVHLIHPRPVTWASLAAFFAAELSVPLVPFEEWLAKVEGYGATEHCIDASRVELLRNTPVLRLLSFFEALVQASSNSSNALGFPGLAGTQAVALSQTLGNPEIPQLGKDDVKMWIDYWRRVNFLTGP